MDNKCLFLTCFDNVYPCNVQALNKFLPGGGAANLTANTGWALKSIWRGPYVNESLFYDQSTANGLVKSIYIFSLSECSNLPISDLIT